MSAGRRGSCRQQQVDAVPRLQHAGDGVDLVDGDGQCADARLDARREHELLGGRYGGRREHLARTHGQQQTLAHQGVELLRRHHRAGHVFGRYGANGHRVAAHDIALVECGIGHHHIDHLLGYGRQAFTLGLDLFVHIARAGIDRHTTAQHGGRHQQQVSMTFEDPDDNGIHGSDMA